MSICFSKSFFLKKFFIYTWAKFFSLYYTSCPTHIYPGNFFAFTTRDPTSLFEFSRFFEQFTQMHKYAYARLVPKNPSFQNVVTFTIISKHLAHNLHIVISLHNYNNCSPIIHYIQFLYCIHFQTCMQLIYCMLDVCGYKLNRLPFPAPL